MKIKAKQQVNTEESLQSQLADLQLKLVENEKILAEKEQELTRKDDTIKSLNHQLFLLRNARFGRKSEKFDHEFQLRLFDEAEPDSPEEAAAKPEEETETISYTRKKNAGRKTLPKSLPYVEIVQDIDEDEKQCDCGCELTHISEEITEKLDVLPQVTYRVVNIKKKYACKTCEETIKTASLPKQPFPKCTATAGLVSVIIDAKFNRHLPLYRQQDIFKSMGVEISRASLSNWVIRAAELLKPLVDLLEKQIRHYDIAYADETTLQVINNPGKSPRTKSYMWLFIGGPPDKQAFVYQYHPTRADSVAKDFFDGFNGYLHADCYRAYINLSPAKVTHVACWAHARRYFADIVKATNKKKGRAQEAIKQIAKLYAIEKELKAVNASTATTYLIRQQRSKPVLDELETWLKEIKPKAPPKSPLGKAIAYSLNHWNRLIRYIDDGRLDIDNNLSERSIKPFVIGRKNWLFNNNEKGANAASTLYSLIQTCKAHQVDVFAYFKYAIDNIIHCQSENDYIQLLPFNCNEQALKKQRDIPHLIHPDK